MPPGSNPQDTNRNNEMPAWMGYTNEDVPVEITTCVNCSQEPAIPFDIKGKNEDHPIDDRLGLNQNTVTLDWYINRSFATPDIEKYLPKNAEELDFRDTFLLQVMRHVSRICSVEKFAEIYAYLGVEKFEFNCLEDYVDDPTHGTALIAGMIHPFAGQPATDTAPDSFYFTLRNNFIFGKSVLGRNTIDYTSYTKANGKDGNTPLTTSWELEGKYDIRKAATEFLAHYETQKENDEWWRRFWGGIEVGLAVLSVVPIVGQFSAAARGSIAAVKATKYAFYAIEALLTADLFTHGTTQLINGEGISLGEDLFKKIGALADPINGEERGAQAFLVLNLALLTPLIAKGTRRVFIRISAKGSPATYENGIAAIERNTGKPPLQGEALGIRLDVASEAKAADGTVVSRTTTHMTPSLDTKSTHFAIVSEGDKIKANICLKVDNIKDELTTLIQQGASKGKISNVVGRFGEAHLEKYLVETLGVDQKHILGAIENASGQGLDFIFKVPPPPSMTRRVPTTKAERDGIAGSVSSWPNKTETIHFIDPITKAPLKPGEKTIVMEVKTTMTLKTPALGKTTQAKGGAANTQRVVDSIMNDRAYYQPHNMTPTPDYKNLAIDLEDAISNNRIDYFTTQIFLDSTGNINKGVGGGTGIQFGRWDELK